MDLFAQKDSFAAPDTEAPVFAEPKEPEKEDPLVSFFFPFASVTFPPLVISKAKQFCQKYRAALERYMNALLEQGIDMLNLDKEPLPLKE